jgi:hypothetical protein
MSYPGQKAIKIGTVLVPKGYEKTTHYECAAWYTESVTTEDQTVDLVALTTRDADGQIQLDVVGHSIWFKAMGTITGSDFSPLFCGNRIGSKVDADKGKDFEFGVSTASYLMIASILSGESTIGGCRFTLDPEWQIKETPGIYTGGPDAGKPYVYRTIVKREVANV